jgi:hypothetical protein
MPCPFCGHLLPKNAEKCDRCDWTRGATETAEGKASDAVAVILSVIPGLGHIYKGHRLAGFLWMAGAIPVGIFVLLAAIASAGFGIGLFFFYLIAVMLHAYAVDDRIVPPREDEGEEYKDVSNQCDAHRAPLQVIPPRDEFLPEFPAFRSEISIADNAPEISARR